MEYMSLLWMAAIFAVMYFLMIRPENKRKKAAQAMRESLKKGDLITTIGGIVGKIVHVSPETVVIETSEDRVRMEITRWAVSSIGVQNSEQASGSQPETAKLNGEPVDEEKK